MEAWARKLGSMTTPKIRRMMGVSSEHEKNSVGGMLAGRNGKSLYKQDNRYREDEWHRQKSITDEIKTDEQCEHVRKRARKWAEIGLFDDDAKL